MDHEPAILMSTQGANTACFERLCAGGAVLVDVRPAGEVCPWLAGGRRLLHAGPPSSWGRFCGPVSGALEGAAVFEEWATTCSQAAGLAAEGGIEFAPTHHHRFVGPVAGVVSPSMWVFCVENPRFGNRAYCTMSEGVGRALRFGAQGDDVLLRLHWMREVLGPTLSEAVGRSDGIDLKEIIRLALEMGDECHNRHEAARLLLLRQLYPALLGSTRHRGVVAEVIEFIARNYYFFVNLAMAASKAMADPIADFRGSSLVSVMARNGAEFGIRVAGLGDRWFTAPCERIHGICFPGYTEADGNPDLGDSTITETVGIGAFAAAAAPAICRYIGGTPGEMLAHTLEMYRITEGEHAHFRIPSLGDRGTPTGIDVEKVVATRISPTINSSIAHRDPGVGQIGAGRTRAPLACFDRALAALRRLGHDDVGRAGAAEAGRCREPDCGGRRCLP